MLLSFSVFCPWIKYLQKASIGFWLLGLLGCKDFKSWEISYICEIKIKFEEKKDACVPDVLEDLQSVNLSERPFQVQGPIVTSNNINNPFCLKDSLSISLNPNAHAVSFALAAPYNDTIYYHKVTIYYQRITSLISPKAGGLQIQYIIKNIQFHTQANTSPIFKRFTIDNPVPLKADKEEHKTHVTLHY